MVIILINNDETDNVEASHLVLLQSSMLVQASFKEALLTGKQKWKPK